MTEYEDEDVDEQNPTTKEIMCRGCGQLKDVPEYDNRLWEIYHRIRDGRSNYDALVFDSEWMQENIHDEEDMESLNHTMEKDMANRGLCPSCGRPDLRNVKPEDILSEEDAVEIQDMWAMERQERMMGA